MEFYVYEGWGTLILIKTLIVDEYNVFAVYNSSFYDDYPPTLPSGYKHFI